MPTLVFLGRRDTALCESSSMLECTPGDSQRHHMWKLTHHSLLSIRCWQRGPYQLVTGLVTMGFEMVEVVSVNSKWGDAFPIALVQQIIIFVLGLTIFALAAYLWRAEYRDQSFLARYLSHA